ncbi:MAG: hypothetical protein PW788_11240 [Micavibrio sp.]|nr:hypothetical protein [Micavibrio sp.]
MQHETTAPATLKTFVEFIRPTKKDPNGIATVMEVKNRDIASLDIPRMTDFFYFFDAMHEGATRKNVSPLHIIAIDMMDREEAKSLIAPNLTPAQRARMGWDPRLENNDLFALTRNNNLEVVGHKTIVLDTKRQQVYPPVKPQLKEKFNPASFNPALVQGVKPMKPVRFRPPAPGR